MFCHNSIVSLCRVISHLQNLQILQTSARDATSSSRKRTGQYIYSLPSSHTFNRSSDPSRKINKPDISIHIRKQNFKESTSNLPQSRHRRPPFHQFSGIYCLLRFPCPIFRSFTTYLPVSQRGGYRIMFFRCWSWHDGRICSNGQNFGQGVCEIQKESGGPW